VALSNHARNLGQVAVKPEGFVGIHTGQLQAALYGNFVVTRL
jgi:hypothetical protein